MTKKNYRYIFFCICLTLTICSIFIFTACNFDGIVDPVVSDDPITPYVATQSPTPDAEPTASDVSTPEATTQATTTATQVQTSTPSPTKEPTATPTVKTDTPPEGTKAPSPTPTPTQKPTHSPTPTQKPTPTPTQKPTPTPTIGLGNDYIKFSHKAGFYSKIFTLKLEYDNSYKVYYTKNGDEPEPGKNEYTSSGIKLYATHATTGESDSINIIKVALFTSTGEKIGETATATYIINSKYLSFTDRYNNLGVISISCNYDSLYDSQTGIFYHDASKGTYDQNYMQRGREWERECHVEMFETDGDIAFSIDAGLRIFGGTSRGLPQKSLRLIARKEYDSKNGKFKHVMYPERTDINGNVIDEYDSFILRSGGNDSLFGSSSRNTFFRDDLTGMLSASMDNVTSMYSRTVVVYINGTYWGFYNLRDDMDTDHLQEKYGVDADSIGIVTYGHENGNWIYDVDTGPASVLDDYRKMISTINSLDMRNDSNYKIADSLLDLDNFAKYMLINMYVNNRDWPHNNVRAWKYIGNQITPDTYSDGKWRFIVKDTDYAWGIYDRPGQVENVVATETTHNKSVIAGTAGELSQVLTNLLKNETFKNMFVNIACDICNEYFSPIKINSLVDSFASLVEKEYAFMASQTWYGSSISQKSYSKWKNENLKTLYDYAKIRPEVFMNLIKNNVLGGLELGQLEITIVNPQYGSVSISSIDFDQSTTLWNGNYFTQCDIPINIQALEGHNYTISFTEGDASINGTNITMGAGPGAKITITFI